MKTLNIQASLPIPGDTQSLVENLRQSYPEATLTPVVPPYRICPFKADTIASLNNTDGTATHFLQTSSLTLWAINPDNADGLIEIGQLPARVNTVFTSPDGLRLLTDEGNYLVFRTAGNTWTLRQLDAPYPAVAILPTATHPATVYTPACSLSGTYTSWGGAFTKADISMLGNNLLAAMRSASSSLLAQGCHTAPLLAWYRLRDAAGKIIFRSMPTLVTPEGIQGPVSVDTSVTVNGGAYRAVAAAEVKVNGYKVALKADPALITSASRRAASIELMTAPSVDLIDYNGTVQLTCLAHTATEGGLRMQIPRLPRHNTILPKLLDRIDEVSTVAAVLFNPFASDSPLLSSGWVPDIAAESLPGESQPQIAAALKIRPEAETLHTVMRESRLPHSFTAATAVTAGDIVALAGITPRHSLPMPLDALCTTGTSRGIWRTKICINLINSEGNTERLCAESMGDGLIPTSILPLISYPHPGAFRCDIEITTPAGTVGTSLPMVPTPSGLHACYITPSLQPIAISSLPAVSTSLRAVTERKSVRHQSMLMIAETSDPFSPDNAIDIAGMPVTALSHAPRSSSGLAFGRRHIYAFTSAGIYAVSINEKRSMAASLIDTAPVTSPAAVASAGGVLYAATPDAVVKIDGTRVIPVIPGKYSSVDYNTLFQELWCLRTPGTASPSDPGTLTILDRSGNAYTRTDIQPTALTQTTSALLAATRDAVYDTSTEEIGAAPDTPITWSRRICLVGDNVPRIMAAAVLMASENASISLDLLGDNGADAARATQRPQPDPAVRPHRFAGISAEGEIAAKLYLPVLAHPHRYVTIRLSGIVDPLTTLTSFHLSLAPRPIPFPTLL